MCFVSCKALTTESNGEDCSIYSERNVFLGGAIPNESSTNL